jgi:urease accessory protein
MHLTKRTAFGLATIAALGAGLATGTASAHTGVGTASGFGAGFLHPILGLDHLAAMLAAGVWAGQLGGRARVALPGAFLALIAAGMALGMATPAFALTEVLILVSLAVIGLLIALEARLRTVWAAALVGLFALFHGHAHGPEVTEGVAGIEYMAGFALATAMLHGVGIGAVATLGARFRSVVRFAGAASALIGVALATGLVA